MQKESKLYLGDCLEVVPTLETESIDAIVTDPPYQLSALNAKNPKSGFMGKEWDLCPSTEIWSECLRVLKPGAFAFIMSSPRQDALARMIYRVEEAGFNIGVSSIYWTYATGFPKAQNISMIIDKQECKKQLTKKLGRKPTKEEFEKAWKEFREVKRQYTPPDGRTRNYKKWGKNTGTVFVGGSDKINELGRPITVPTTEEAKALDGAYGGFQPKPAVEVVIVAMKPLSEKTYVDQALRNKHGCTWLDECRIPFESKDLANTIEKRDSLKGANVKGGFRLDGKLAGIVNNKGRFPANVLCEDDVQNDGRIIPSSERPNSIDKSYSALQPINFYGKETKMTGYCDSGSYSRYFSLDAWFAERIKRLPKEAQQTFPWLIVPKASKSEKNRELEDFEKKQINDGRNKLPDNPFQRGVTYRTNTHSTVKPLKLMSWLITLATQEGDIVLDPFMGTGTTCIAAKALGRYYKGIEMDEEHFNMAQMQIDNVQRTIASY